MVREIREDELPGLLELYLHLHETSVPEMTGHLEEIWRAIVRDPN